MKKIVRLTEKEKLQTIKNKKIAERFLKESGLYAAWKAYLNQKGIDLTSAYFFPNVENVFGTRNFTYYLETTCGLKLPIQISEVFRIYLRKENGTNTICIGNIIIDKVSKTIKIL